MLFDWDFNIFVLGLRTTNQKPQKDVLPETNNIGTSPLVDDPVTHDPQNSPGM